MSIPNLDYLHIPVSTNHSMIEEPALFTVIGLNAFWMWVPKLIMAIIVVQSYRGLKFIRGRFIRQGAN